MCSDVRVCIVLLIGIPGSGKSFFRKFLENYFSDDFYSVLGSVMMFSVSYDNYDHIKIPNQSSGNKKWKNDRIDVMKLVGNILKLLKSNSSFHKDLSKEFPGIFIVNRKLQKPDSSIILIDDNMYYRSMRYEYYKLARSYNISFFQIFFDISLEKAFKNNSERPNESKVPETVIESMFIKIEPPQLSRLWEMQSVSISSYGDFQNQQLLNNILNGLKNALDNPLKTDSLSLSKDEAHQETSSNAFHQIDNILKQLVAVRIKSKISIENKSDLKIMSKLYSEKRLYLLKQIKARNIILPFDLSEAVTNENINMAKSFLSELLFDS